MKVSNHLLKNTIKKTQKGDSPPRLSHNLNLPLKRICPKWLNPKYPWSSHDCPSCFTLEVRFYREKLKIYWFTMPFCMYLNFEKLEGLFSLSFIWTCRKCIILKFEFTENKKSMWISYFQWLFFIKRYFQNGLTP